MLNSVFQYRSHGRSPEGGHQEQDPSNRQNGQSVLSSQVRMSFLPVCLKIDCVVAILTLYSDNLNVSLENVP